MFDQSAATAVVNDYFPGAEIKGPFLYNGLWLFRVYTDDPEEGEADPFFAVNPETGELRGFSILTEGDIDEITVLFQDR